MTTAHVTLTTKPPFSFKAQGKAHALKTYLAPSNNLTVKQFIKTQHRASKQPPITKNTLD